MRIVLAALLLAFAAGEVAAFNPSRSGTAAGAFLTLGAGARAAGLAEACSAAVDDASALYWNPGAMIQVRRRSAVLMHSVHLAETSFDYASFVQRFGDRGAFGLSLQHFSSARLDRTDATGMGVGSFHPYDLAATAGYAVKLTDRLSIGAGIKLIHSRILATAQTVAADAGLLWARDESRLRLSLTATNLGGKLRYDRESERLPSAFRLGSLLSLTQRWKATADVGLPSTDEPFGAAGTEYDLLQGDGTRLAGRAGISSKTISDIDGFTGISFGVGIGLGGYTLDYALVPFGNLGQSHRLGVSCAF